jgi:uncharacterized membrane protein YhaH (DUF805 family)
MWVLAYRDTFTLIAGNILNNIAVVALLVFGLIKSPEMEQKILLGVIAFCFVLPVFLYAALLIFKPMRDYTRSVRRCFISPVALVIYVVATAAPLAVPFYMKQFMYPTEIVADAAQVTADGYRYGHDPAMAYDSNQYTWWIPQNRVGKNSFLKFDFEKPLPLCRLTMESGAQWSGAGDDDDVNLFDDYSRPKKIEVVFSNGGSLQFDVKDTSETQGFSFRPVTAGSVKVNILETYKGKKSDELCVTEISFGKPGKYFSKTDFSIFAGSESDSDE